jgi:outer membrane protein assembly factor BamD
VNRNILLTAVITAFLVVSGCANKNAIRPGDTADVAFMKAKTLYERGRYLDAARGFDTVLGISRGSALAQESQWLLADSYFKARDYLMASAEYRRYAETFPRSERRPEAEYQEGLCYVRLSPRYNLDQKDTYRAIESMQLFIARYPAHERTVDAAQIIDQMRDKLARKQYAAGEMYLRIQAFEAAAIYFGLTIDQYPETAWAERALAKQAESYFLFAERSVATRQAERYRLVVGTYEKYVQLFPRGENRAQVEQLVDQAREALRRIQA